MSATARTAAAVALFALPSCQPAALPPAARVAESVPTSVPVEYVDCEGKRVDLARFRGTSAVVLVVLRGVQPQLGGFCPNCLAQTGSLMAHAGEFRKRGAEVCVVFPGPSAQAEEFLGRAREQAEGGQPDSLAMLVDDGAAACERLGVRADAAKPSTFILDRQGHLVYAYVGTTDFDRPTVQAVLGQLDRINARL